MKIRRIDYSPDEFLVGVAGMDADAIGIYWVICSLIYSTGDAVKSNDARIPIIAKCHGKRLRIIINDLKKRGKLIEKNGCLFNKRSEIELQKARNRSLSAWQNGVKGGRKPIATESQLGLNIDPVLSQNNDIEEPGGSCDQKLTINHQPSTINHQRKKETPYSPPSGDESGSKDLPLEDKRTEQEAVRLWNETAKKFGLPECRESISSARRSKLRQRLRDAGGLDGWRTAMGLIGESSFLRGEKTDFRATFDFVLRAVRFEKLMEGGYSDKKKHANGNGRDTTWVGGAIQKLIAAGAKREKIGTMGLDGLSIRSDREVWLKGQIETLRGVAK